MQSSLNSTHPGSKWTILNFSPLIFLFRFSGITAKTLENVTTTLAEVQKHLVGLLPPDAILLGHSLENDLRALKVRCCETCIKRSTITDRS